LEAEATSPKARSVTVTDGALRVELTDGRSIDAPLAWYPRLLHASQAERQGWRLTGQGHGIHWDAIDEDISVEGLLAGRPSGESARSLARWIESRATGAADRRRAGEAPDKRGST